MTGMMSPKVNTDAAQQASRLAAEEELKAKKAAEQGAADEEYRRTRQQGRSATVLTSSPSGTGMRSLLGG